MSDLASRPETIPFTMEARAPWLIAHMAKPHRTLSWAVHRPGYQRITRIAWLEVCNADLPLSLDPLEVVRARAASDGLDDAVIMVTSAPLAYHHTSSSRSDGVQATCLVTLGLSNGERVGSRLAVGFAGGTRKNAAGTINLLCHVSCTLSDSAMLEAISIATQARTVGVLSHGYERFPGAGAVTGTGTDCLVIACPDQGAEEPYAGLHTPVGETIGAAVLQATDAAMTDWIGRNGNSFDVAQA